MNVDHARRKVIFLDTLEKCDILLIRRCSPFSFETVQTVLKDTTFIQRNDLGEQLAKTIQRQSSNFQLLARSMLRWVIRKQKKNTHSSTASLLIFGGAPGSGKSHMATERTTERTTDAVTYDSDADKLRILYLLKMTPTMLETEEALVEFLEPSGIKIEWLGDYLQPLQRIIRESIFKGLAELCYDVTVIGLHANIESLQKTADAFRDYKDCSFHFVDIFEQPEEQERRLSEREKEASHFAILPIAYARKAAVSMHEMVRRPELGKLAASRNAEVLLTTIGSFREPLGRCRAETTVLVKKNTLPPLRPRSYTM